jgi:hypothetical protein
MDTQITPMPSMLDDNDHEFAAWTLRDEAVLDPVRHSNCTLIQTLNSFYLFLLTDPTERRGLLVGGALGECPTSAILLGGVPHADDRRDYPTDLNTGVRAVFLVESAGGSKHVITSRVVSLAHAALDSRERRPVCH